MEHLPGSARLDWSGKSEREVKRLHERMGETLARIHQVQRAWPGWIALPERRYWPWGPTLFGRCDAG